MSTLSIDELKAKAADLGVELVGDETDDTIESLIQAKTSQNNPPPAAPEEEDDTEILAMRAQVQQKIDEKKGAGNAKKYSEEDVNEMMRRLEKKLSGNRESEDEDFIDLLDPTAVKRKFVRLARMKNGDKYKFVVGLKNMNTDTYIDEPIYVTNVENPNKKGEYIPWATLVFQDGAEELYPYLSFMNRASGVWAEVIEEKQTDVSERFGVVDVKAIDQENEWDLKNTGKKVLAKALKYRIVYVCKDIKEGNILNVSEDVINKVEAPYSELKKFLEEIK